MRGYKQYSTIMSLATDRTTIMKPIKTLWITSLIFISTCNSLAYGESKNLTLRHPNRINSLCANAHLRGLRFTKLGSLRRIGNACTRNESRLPTRIRATIGQIGELHSLVTEYFHQANAFPIRGGVDLEIKSSPWALLNSKSLQDDRYIQMGVFANWRGGDIDPSTYLHEFGHLLGGVYATNNFAPFAKFRYHDLLQEALSDEFALTLLGSLAPTTSDLQRFPWDGRIQGSDYTYRSTIATIAGTQWAEDKYQFCVAVKKDPASPEIDKKACNSKGNRGATKHFKNLDQRTLDQVDLSTLGENPMEWWDPHYAGFPIVSFMGEFRARSGTTRSPLLDFLASGASSDVIESEYQCVNQITHREKALTSASFAQVFSMIRAHYIASADLATYDQLWSEYGMELGLQLAASLELRRVVPIQPGWSCQLKPSDTL